MKKLDNETLDNIVLLREKGLPLDTVTSIIGVGQATVTRAMQAYKAASEKDYNALAKLNEISASTVLWACERHGISLTDGKSEAKKDETPDNTAHAFVALLEAVKMQTESIKELTAAVNAIDKRLSAMQLTQQGLRGEIGEKIKSVCESVNVNGDILTKEHDKMIDLLGGIKQNTKKRPWQEGTEK